MADSVILNTPVLLLLFAAALFLCVFDRLRKATRGWFSVVAAILAVAGAAWALILGAGTGEVLTVLLLFLCLNLEGWK
ncbi:MAG: hypothetical protein IJE07_09300 [Clostridia bacterium]|nr:hypothetical protein [Clostridia bacterium]